MGALKVSLVLQLLTAVAINAVPVNIPLGHDNVGTLNFNLELPNNDTVEIGLSFKLLTTTTDSASRDSVGADVDKVAASTTTMTPLEVLDKNFVSVEEAIEGFRQNLIKKEMEIAGIIESTNVFYRHFMLEFSDDVHVAIRCTYDSDYEQRLLRITCYEYHEYETERILSNGEVEIIKKHDPGYKSDVEILNLKSMKQTYKMDIS